MRPGLKRALGIAFKALIVLVLLLVVAFGTYVFNNLTYHDRAMAGVKRAGFVEKDVTVGGSRIHYAEGPDNGPALLLIHGQLMDWTGYARVLPDLAEEYHVFVVDCYGHGKSEKDPQKYSAKAMGRDLVQFIRQVIGEPVVVSGHSSGGLLAVWLTAHSPEWVRGAVFEDPPLFTTLFPRAEKTFNYVDLSTICHRFVQQREESDFTLYYVRNSYLLKFFQDARPGMIRYAENYRKKHRDRPLRYWFMPPVMNEGFRTLPEYDPRFGVTFYDGSWNEGFDHAAALKKIEKPTVLILANWSYDENGILLAAMDEKDARRAHTLLKNNRLIKVDSGHNFHFEKPREFVRILLDFKKRIG
ncbi:pimeloyl-ACP methyl ester carboxylesterase [Planifilum fimeticola]|jgi:pimeloyl-ACP methyl ester carboxylesterase|uniref:Pimeloyl-ACP methyl ester carboxylesterase n=1 Tax=Planifilum fimeticola TaxID=201975 RepID=A0A2T0LET7_9BACL|nr:alpha/beta hydrolase [Planifilum fimeticola]PRX40672.1 pimeloyl-ACP methyl ester carboxylesterase [Planifilum fimeticola]